MRDILLSGWEAVQNHDPQPQEERGVKRDIQYTAPRANEADENGVFSVIWDGLGNAAASVTEAVTPTPYPATPAPTSTPTPAPTSTPTTAGPLLSDFQLFEVDILGGGGVSVTPQAQKLILFGGAAIALFMVFK